MGLWRVLVLKVLSFAKGGKRGARGKPFALGAFSGGALSLPPPSRRRGLCLCPSGVFYLWLFGLLCLSGLVGGLHLGSRLELCPLIGTAASTPRLKSQRGATVRNLAFFDTLVLGAPVLVRIFIRSLFFFFSAAVRLTVTVSGATSRMGCGSIIVAVCVICWIAYTLRWTFLRLCLLPLVSIFL